ncbi:MAG: cob(I)yrinic acid a,c-diamide adenosyltransferase, partial [Gaiellaceae bacterium]
MSARRRDEPVRLTRIYTRGGDRGETSLGDGSRVPKLDCR